MHPTRLFLSNEVGSMRTHMKLLMLVISVAAVLFPTHSGLAQTGSISITPTSGPIGTVVTITGSGCNNPGQQVILSFEGGDPASGVTGTLGASPPPAISPSPESTFTATFAIPEQLETLQGQGGGAVLPGVYRFASHPPLCDGRFTVIGPDTLPTTGGEPLSTATRSSTAILLTGFILMSLGIYGLFVTQLTGPNRSPE